MKYRHFSNSEKILEILKKHSYEMKKYRNKNIRKRTHKRKSILFFVKNYIETFKMILEGFPVFFIHCSLEFRMKI